jgi:transposase-like protein
MSTTRRSYRPEFKLHVVQEVEAGSRVSELARRHQIHPNLIYRWKRQYRDGGPKAFTQSPSGRLKSEAAKIAEWAVPTKPQVQTDSTYRRIQTFFEKFASDYEDLGRFLLDLVRTDPPHAVVLDRTEWHFGSAATNALVAGVAHGGIAYPVAWTVLDHEGGSGAAEQIEVVGRLTDVLALGDIGALMADREFTGADWIEALADRDIPFVRRLKSDRCVARPDGPALPVRMFVRPLSEDPSRLLDGPYRIGGTGEASASKRAGCADACRHSSI